ncbi:MAG: metallophosphoesterase [Nanoarchaeota archaeon]|nr:metallophosphoesterase [Nanoarchaeota archaeon]
MYNSKFVKIAHISDLHFGRTVPEMVDACKASLKEYKPDLVVVTGDLVFWGRRSEFIQARKFLDSLPYEKVVVPGNHDVFDGFFLPKINPWKRLRAYYRYFPFNRDVRIGNLEVVGLDSTTFYALGRGRVNIGELDRVSKDKNVVKCIALHHHVIAIPGTGEGNTITNVDAVISELIKHNIRYVFHGHRHKRMHFRLDSFVWDKKLDNPVDIFSCGTTLSRRFRGGDPYGNYNRIVIDTSSRRNRFSYLNMMFDEAKKRFVPRDKGFKI